MKYKFIKYNKKTDCLVFSGSKTQFVNKREMSAISEKKIQGVLQIDIQRDSPPVRLSMNIAGLISLSCYLKNTMITEQSLVCIIKQIISTIKAADSLNFNRRLFIYNADYMFIDQFSQTVFLIYVPLQPCELEGNISYLLTQIVKKSSFNPSEDLSFLRDFIKIINSNDFSMFALDEFLSLMKHDSNSPKAEGFFSNSQSTTLDNSITCSNCGEGNTNSNLEVQKKCSVFMNEYPSGLVTVFGVPEQDEYVLIDKQTGQEIVIDKTPFRIGKQLYISDYCIKSEAVSRKHAEIIRDNGECYIVDLNSKNGTFVNGCSVRGGIKVMLHENDIVSFANLRYLFRKKRRGNNVS